MSTSLCQEQLFVALGQVLSLPLDLQQHFSEFGLDDGSVGIGDTSVQPKQSGSCFVESVLSCEPSWRIGEECHSDKEEDSGDDLDSQWDSPLTTVADELTPVTDPVREEESVPSARHIPANEGRDSPPDDHQLSPAGKQSSGVLLISKGYRSMAATLTGGEISA